MQSTMCDRNFKKKLINLHTAKALLGYPITHLLLKSGDWVMGSQNKSSAFRTISEFKIYFISVARWRSRTLLK